MINKLLDVIIFHVLSIKLTFSYIEKLKEISINIPDKLFNQSVYFKINSGKIVYYR